MNLLIISNMAHYRAKDGQILGNEPVVREINHVTSLFNNVTHVACMHLDPPPKNSLPYRTNIDLVFLPPAGGKTFRDKWQLILQLPRYTITLIKELFRAEIVHVRCPANIPLLAIILLSIFHCGKVRWIKYAGNWSPKEKEPWSYALQRWILKKNFPRCHVTVNGNWLNQPPHVHEFFNPSFSEEELLEAKNATSKKQLVQPIRLIFVGRLEEAKGVGQVLEILNQLKQKEIQYSADLIGDGPERLQYEAMAKRLNLSANFHGWMSRSELSQFYVQAHFILMTSPANEGWPKVLSEAMAFGAIPITSNISSIPYYLNNFGVGMSLKANDINAFVAAIEIYCCQPERWKRESSKAIQSAKNFSYEKYLEKIQQLMVSNL